MPDLTVTLTVALGLVALGLVSVWLVLVVRARLAASDAAAVAEGWTVRRLPWGGRVYRDPRLDQLPAMRAVSAADGRSVHSGREAG